MKWSTGIGSRSAGWLLIVAMFAAATPAYAEIYGFTAITNDSDMDVMIGETQLFLEVLPGTVPTRVRFDFLNLGPEASSICDVYFDDGSLLGIASIINSPGVSFSSPAKPANLPAGASINPPFVTTEEFSADSDPPVQPNGVNPGEVVSIVFDLQAGRDYADVLSDLASADLRVGIHVQGFADGGSESFINNPRYVPAPSTLLLCALGSGLVAWVRRRQLLNA
jgi:hypothetical protein